MQIVLFSIFFTLFVVIGGFEVFRTYRFLTLGQEPATEFLPHTQTQWLGLILATVTLMLVVFMAAASYVILHSPIGV